MPAGIPKQETRRQQDLVRHVERNRRQGRRHSHQDGSGRRLENVAFEPYAQKDVKHGLKVVPRGVIVLGVRAAGVPFVPKTVRTFHRIGDANERYLLEELSRPAVVTAVSWVSGLTIAAHADHPTLTISQGDLNNGALTPIAAVSGVTQTFTVGTKVSLSPATASAEVAAGLGIYLVVGTNGGATAVGPLTVQVEYQGGGCPIPVEPCDSEGRATDRTKDTVRLENLSGGAIYADLWVY